MRSSSSLFKEDQLVDDLSWSTTVMKNATSWVHIDVNKVDHGFLMVFGDSNFPEWNIN